MPVNRNALIRYKTIDSCLKNRRRKWTLEDLIEKVSDALYEYEGISKGISRRTIQADIQVMRSDKLGYNAPIIITEKKYYTYEDAEYSITNIPLNEQDLGRMSEAVGMLKQFKGFSHFGALNEVVQKLEDHVYAASHSTDSVIDFEKNDRLRGLDYLDAIYNAIVAKKALNITYQSFKAKAPDTIKFHGWWLKEFKNRWFVVGVKEKQPHIVVTLALDRMQVLEVIESASYIPPRVTAAIYYQHVIGVTVSDHLRAQKVRLFFTGENAPYVETKPLHHTQFVAERRDDGIVVQMLVQLNFELEKEILGFGEGVEVLAPASLRKRIRHRVNASHERYLQEIIEE